MSNRVVTPKQLEALRILSSGTVEEKAKISTKTYLSLATRFLATYNERGITASGQGLLNMKSHYQVQKLWEQQAKNSAERR